MAVTTRVGAEPVEGRAAWLIAAGVAIGAACALGPAFIASFGLYLKPIAASFGWSRTQVAAIYAIVAIIGAVGSLGLGFVLDRFGSRPVILAATVVLPLMLGVMVLLPDRYPAFIAWGIALGFVAIIASPAAYINLIPQWFGRRVGLALALGMTGSGLGQALFLEAHAALLARLDWRQAWLTMAIVVALIGITNAVLLLRDNAPVLALRRAGRDADLVGITVRNALATPVFWCASTAFFLVMLIIGAMLTHLAPLLSDRGQSVAQAAGIVAFMGIASLCGRIATGLVIDRIGYGVMGLAFFPMQAAGCLVLAAGMGGIWYYIAAGLIGLTYGVEADMLPFMLRRTFGLRSFGRLYGIAFGLVQFGPVIGPLLLGYSFDRFGSYHRGLLVLAGLSGVATVLIGVTSRLRLPQAEILLR